MAFVQRDTKLWQVLDSIVADEGLALYDVEKLGAHSLRVFVQKQAKEEGVTSGDTSKVVRRLMVYFLAEGPGLGLPAEPEIEVSSPGINRHLRLPEQFTGAVGERVKINSRKEGPESSVIGTLKSVAGETVEIVDERTERPVSFRMEEIKRAHVEYKF